MAIWDAKNDDWSGITKIMSFKSSKKPKRLFQKWRASLCGRVDYKRRNEVVGEW